MSIRASAWQAINHPWMKLQSEEEVEKKAFKRVSRKICDYYVEYGLT